MLTGLVHDLLGMRSGAVMGINRSEIFVLGYAALLAAASAVGWYGARLVAMVAATVSPNVVPMADRAILMINLSASLLAICAVIALIWLYPATRRAAHKHGQLTRENKSYLAAALTDPLTGLQNRRYFDDALAEYIKAFGPIDLPLGIVLVDIDHFKAINDTHGHDNGDLVLHALAQCLRQHTRYHDVVARVGGEEFAILFAHADRRALAVFAERIRTAIDSMSIVLDGQPVPVSASLGYALWDGSEKAATLLKRADRNLYKAKSCGRNCIIGETDPADDQAGVAA